MSLSYLQYDVFTSEPLRGNQLAVFTDARGLDGDQMQQIAREMNFSETTFVLAADDPGIDIRMRIFTPYLEMPMAGHPTIGSAFALAHTGVIPPGATRVIFGLNIGPIPVDLEWNDDGLGFAWMTQSNPAFGPIIEDRTLVASALGLRAEDIAEGLPVQAISCGVSYVLVPLRDQRTVDRVSPDSTGFRRLAELTSPETAVFVFSVQPPTSTETVYSRMFSNDFGIIEDPATGSASGPLGCYLVAHGLVRGDDMRHIISRQGVAMGRASVVHVQIEADDREVTEVRVGGAAVLVGRGELFL
jgi:trans-2,3-dihydro-3-hydroxyanthranilate isomerase